MPFATQSRTAKPGTLAGWVCAVLLACLLPVAAQETPVESFSTLREYAEAIPKLRQAPVQIRGILTQPWGRAFFMQDQTAGVLVLGTDPLPPTVKIGDEVEVNGTAFFSANGPQIRMKQLKVLGKGTLPPAIPLKFTEALDRHYFGRLVEIQGRFTAAVGALGPGRAIILETDGHTFCVENVLDDGSTRWPQMEVGGLVKATGVAYLPPANDPSLLPLRIFLRTRAEVGMIAPAPRTVTPAPLATAPVAAVPVVKDPSWLKPPRIYRLIAFVGVCITIGLVVLGVLRHRLRQQAAQIRSHYERQENIARRYRDLFENATDVVLSHDLNGQITSFNPAGERLLGWTSAEVIGRNIDELFAPEERGNSGGITVSGRNAAVRESGSVFSVYLLTKDGGRLPFEVNSWLESQDGRPVGMQAICRNVAERRRLETERARLEHKQQETQKLESLGVLAGGIAHDFNNLLTGILGNASLARLDVAPHSSTGECLEQIEKSAERAADLCKQMLAYSGHGRFVVQRLDLDSLVRQTADTLRLSLSENIMIDLKLNTNTVSVLGDPVQLRQIVSNLVTNAAEAIGENSGLITITTQKTQVTSDDFDDARLMPDVLEGDFLSLEVADTGTGMNADTAERIFDPFFTTKFTGRGLGLAAVLGIVRGHRGSVKVTSEPGKGTRLRVLLPSAGPLPKVEVSNFLQTPERGSRGLVLVVDDEETVRVTTKGFLESGGFTVLVAADGVEALEVFRKEGTRLSAVVLDLTMPRMDGAEAFRQMRESQPAIPVLLMSGFAEPQALARFAGLGLAGFVQKPFRPDVLRTRVEAAIKIAAATLPANVIAMRA